MIQLALKGRIPRRTGRIGEGWNGHRIVIRLGRSQGSGEDVLDGSGLITTDRIGQIVVTIDRIGLTVSTSDRIGQITIDRIGLLVDTIDRIGQIKSISDSFRQIVREIMQRNSGIEAGIIFNASICCAVPFSGRE